MQLHNKTNTATVRTHELHWKGRRGLRFLCSRLMSRSNSQQPAVLSNCISDALLSRFTCPILLSHRLAASQQRRLSMEMERAAWTKKKRTKWNTGNVSVKGWNYSKMKMQSLSSRSHADAKSREGLWSTKTFLDLKKKMWNAHFWVNWSFELFFPGIVGHFTHSSPSVHRSLSPSN